MSLKALQEYTYYSKYARYKREAGRRETWGEAVDRVKEMHLRKYGHLEGVAEDIEWAFEQVKQRRVLGSQRALQFGGKPIEEKSARLYNCISSYCDRARFFQECFWLLLCGCGTGFSVQTHHVAKLPEFGVGGPDPNRVRTFVIPDTIEGWADALGVLLASYMTHPDFPDWGGCRVEFDPSQIRPQGSRIASGSGKAPGPEPLMRALEKVRQLLDRCVREGRGRLRPIDAYDIMMHASDAVLSGGVRRSATLCIFSLEDEEMIAAKTGNWFVENPQRGRSNNSALLVRGEVTREQFLNLMASVKQFGEPGFIWADDRESLYNPCVEINLYGYDEFGNSGWQACVSADTKLITRSGMAPISELVGESVEIWNGEAWSEVTPRITGHGRKLYRVTLGDGSYLDCTDNHKWLVKDRFQEDYSEVATRDLMGFSKYQISTPRAEVLYGPDEGVWIEWSYEYGFIMGDGCSRGLNRSPVANLFKDDRKLSLVGSHGGECYNINGTPYLNMSFPTVDRELCLELTRRTHLPELLFSWSRASILEFMAGWIDADGSRANDGCRLYGTEGALRDAQLLLTKVGVNSSLNLCQKAGSVTNLATRKRDLWYLQIVDAREIPSRRLDLSLGKPARCRGKAQVIESVVELPGLHTTYCVDELRLHQCLFNNVLTKQCNLCEINGRKIKTVEDFSVAARAAAIIGTLQAGYTDFPYLGGVSERIIRREALLGVSITGMMDNPDVIFDPEVQREMAALIIRVNEEMAVRIGINPAARTTCVKPAGTTSCILGSSSGIHPHHAKRYFRRVQANAMERPLQHFRVVNPRAVERSVWSANQTDEVITFCVEVDSKAKCKTDLSALELLGYVELTQQNWVAAGKVPERCVKPWLSHNVSNTINVRPDEWDGVGERLYDHRANFAGVSLLPSSGDLDYPQAPFTTIHTPREILSEYGDGSLFASGLIVDGLHAFDNNLWAACDAVVGLGESLEEPPVPQGDDVLVDPGAGLQYDERSWATAHARWASKVDWVRRVRQFAERYCDGDVRRSCYLMKEVSNWKTWKDLTRTYGEVDYTEMFEVDDETTVGQESACSGPNGCELPAEYMERVRAGITGVCPECGEDSLREGCCGNCATEVRVSSEPTPHV